MVDNGMFMKLCWSRWTYGCLFIIDGVT